MGIHIEAQEKDEVIQLRSRELQLENTKKLQEMIPIVENIDNVNLNQIENDAAEIKNIVISNLEEQPNIEECIDEINKLTKNISNLKGQITKLSNQMSKMNDTINKSLEEIKDA